MTTPTENTLRGWAAADAEVRDILERDGLARVMPWTNDVVGAYTVHPLASCRIGDDPATSALDGVTSARRGTAGLVA